MIRVSTVRLEGGQGDRISSGFEPTKALVRGYHYPTAVLPRLTDSQDPTSHTTYLGTRHKQDPACGPGRGIQGVTSDRLLAEV